MTALQLRRDADPMVFLSHQSADAGIANALVHLLTQSLGLRPSEIWCTTRGSKFPIGSDVRATMKDEAVRARVFICLVTRSAARSVYVLSEVRARLKSGQRVFPVLGIGARPTLIPELREVSALHCDDRHQLHQLIREVAKELDRKPEREEHVSMAVESALKAMASEEDRQTATRRGRLLPFAAMVALAAGAVYLRPIFRDLYQPPRTANPPAPSRPSPALPPVGEGEPQAQPQPKTSTMPVFEPRTPLAFRKASGAMTLAGPEIETIGALPPGTYAYIHARQLSRPIQALDQALLLKGPNPQACEVQRSPDGTLLLLGFVSPNEQVAIGKLARVTITVRPTADARRGVLVSLPFERFEDVQGWDDLSGPFLRIKLAPASNRGSP